jgi:hypothetical protein
MLTVMLLFHNVNRVELLIFQVCGDIHGQFYDLKELFKVTFTSDIIEYCYRIYESKESEKPMSNCLQ